MSYGWQYHGAPTPSVPPMDSWYQPASEPVHLSPLLAAGVVGISIFAVPQQAAALGGCATSTDGEVRVFEIGKALTDNFIVTWTGEMLGPNGQFNSFLLGDDTFTPLTGENRATEVGFHEIPSPSRIYLDSGPGVEYPIDFEWDPNVQYNFKMLVNLESDVFTLFVDDQLVAYNFPFRNTATEITRWGLEHLFFDRHEVCDVVFTDDTSKFDIVPTYAQDQPLPFPPERPVDEGGTFEIIAPLDVDITVDNWYVQHPEPIPPAPLNQTAGMFFIPEIIELEAEVSDWFVLTDNPILPLPPRQTAGMFFVAEPSTLETGPILLDKWFQPASEPIFLPVRLEHLSPTLMAVPLSAVPLAAQTTQTVATLLRTFVGNVGTKFKIQIRQTRGIGTVVLATVASRSALGVTFHPRSRLLASNQAVLPAVDTYLNGFVGFENSNRETTDDVRIATSNPATFEKRSHLCFQFDVNAFAGLIWRSVKLRLWRTSDFSEGDGDFPVARVARCLRSWDLTGATWNVFDGPSPGGPAWQSVGARGVGTDHTTANATSWIPTDGPEDEMVQLPDITGIVNDALIFDSGILKLIVLYPGTEVAGGFPPRSYHSLEATDATMRPVLFFDAY